MDVMQFTLFTIPREFLGAHSVRQHNAIDTWLQLKPRPEVLLFGNDENVGLVAKKYGLVHVPEVELSPQDVPLVDSAFRLAQQLTKHDVMCYVNTDIMFLQDFVAALTQVAGQFEQFLMVGQRTDLNFDMRLKVDKKDWQQNLVLLARTQGRLHSVGGIDYFAFRRGLYEEVPPFAIGRYCWDNWLLHDVMKRGIPVVNVSKKVLAIHQEHKRWRKTGADYQRNLELYKKGHEGRRWSRVTDASWILDEGGLRQR